MEPRFGLGIEELVLIVSGMTFVWAVVIGFATLRVMREQKRLAEKQGQQGRETAQELREAVMWREKYEVLWGIGEYYARLSEGGRVPREAFLSATVGAGWRSCLFKGEAGEWLNKFGKLALEVEGEMGKEEVAGGEVGERRRRLRGELGRMAETVGPVIREVYWLDRETRKVLEEVEKMEEMERRVEELGRKIEELEGGCGGYRDL